MVQLRTLGPVVAGLGLALVLAGCSGGGTTNEPAAAPSPGGSAAPAPEGTAGTRTIPGASGTIAYVSGQLMQVQDSDSQTAVAWTGTTTISSEVAGTLADVTVGVCVTATSAFTGGDSTAAPTAEPSASAAAARVTITEPTDGTCQTTGFGGAGGFPGGGSFGGGTPGELPSGMATAVPGGSDGGQGGQLPGGVPTDLPSGFPTDGSFGGGAGRAFGGRTSGLVTAVDGTTITVQTTAQDGTTSTATATVDASTTYTKTVAADASAIVVGQCASAFGEADSSGKITATTITVSAPTDGSCTSSFGAGRGTGLTGSRTGSGGEGYRSRGNGSTGSTTTQGGSNA